MSDRGAPSTQAVEHIDTVLAREYWRCEGQAENARQERAKAEADRRAFDDEAKKWEARAAEVLVRLGDVVPENPLPGSVE